MRLAPIKPAEIPPSVQPFHADLLQGIEAHFKGFVSQRTDGALLGPFTPMLHFPHFGQAAWTYTKALIDNSTLPKPVREVAILVVAARFGARYELYAHELLGERAGLAAAKVATIVAGERPSGLTPEEGVAYNVAAALTRNGPLPEATYRAAVAAFGEQGTAELVYMIGGYSMLSVLLNAYDVPIPDSDLG